MPLFSRLASTRPVGQGWAWRRAAGVAPGRLQKSIGAAMLRSSTARSSACSSWSSSDPRSGGGACHIPWACKRAPRLTRLAGLLAVGGHGGAAAARAVVAAASISGAAGLRGWAPAARLAAALLLLLLLEQRGGERRGSVGSGAAACGGCSKGARGEGRRRHG